MARSAQHEVHVEQNHNGAGFLCTLRQKFQFNGIRMVSGRCVFSLLLPFEVTPITVVTGLYFRVSPVYKGLSPAGKLHAHCLPGKVYLYI